MPSLPDLDLNADPAMQALLAEFKRSVEAAQGDMEAHRQQMETEAAMALPSEEALATPNINPARLAEFDRMEAEFGVPMESQGLQWQPGDTAQRIIHAAETVAAAVQGQPRHRPQVAEPQSRKELQWFYVLDSKRVGPVNQSQLLELLEHGELQWDVLVWNKKLSDWTKASESELIDLSEGPPPPPIPSPNAAAKNQTEKEQKCNACGRVNDPDNRFCAGCGKPLRKTRK